MELIREEFNQILYSDPEVSRIIDLNIGDKNDFIVANVDSGCQFPTQIEKALENSAKSGKSPNIILTVHPHTIVDLSIMSGLRELGNIASVRNRNVTIQLAREAHPIQESHLNVGITALKQQNPNLKFEVNYSAA